MTKENMTQAREIAIALVGVGSHRELQLARLILALLREIETLQMKVKEQP